jgi:hypothetical protein
MTVQLNIPAVERQAEALMKNFDPGDRVNFFTSRSPDFLAIRIRVRRIARMHGIVKEPAGDHDTLV